MAYLKTDDLVIIPNKNGSNLQARVVDMQFRRFRRTGKTRRQAKTKVAGSQYHTLYVNASLARLSAPSL
jgi:hypothetical protein